MAWESKSWFFRNSEYTCFTHILRYSNDKCKCRPQVGRRHGCVQSSREVVPLGTTLHQRSAKGRRHSLGVVATDTVTREKRCSGAPCRGTGPLPPTGSGPAPFLSCRFGGRGSRLRYCLIARLVAAPSAELGIQSACSVPLLGQPRSRPGRRPHAPSSQGPRRGRPALSLLGSFGHGAPGRSARALRYYTCGAPTTNVRVPAAGPLRSYGRPAARRPRPTSAIGALPPCHSGRMGPPAPALGAPAAAAAQGLHSPRRLDPVAQRRVGVSPSRIPCWRRSRPAPPSTAASATDNPQQHPTKGKRKDPAVNAPVPESGSYGQFCEEKCSKCKVHPAVHTLLLWATQHLNRWMYLPAPLRQPLRRLLRGKLQRNGFLKTLANRKISLKRIALLCTSNPD